MKKNHFNHFKWIYPSMILLELLLLLEHSVVLNHEVGEAVKHWIKKQKGGLLGMSLGILDASVLGIYVNC